MFFYTINFIKPTMKILQNIINYFFYTSTSVQLSCGCNLYFANHKKKSKQTHQELPATQPTNNNINQTFKENKTNWQKHDARPARCKKRFTFPGKWTELGVKKQSCFSFWRN